MSQITLSYVAAEDRLHVTARLDDGREICLWLTQRLSRALVSALAQHLESGDRLAPASVRKGPNRPLQPLAAARQAPRSPQAGASVHLVHNVRLKLAGERVALRFDSDLDVKPNVVLDRPLACQWLRMLHRQFVKAGWPLDVWPRWLVDGQSPGPIAAATLH